MKIWKSITAATIVCAAAISLAADQDAPPAVAPPARLSVSLAPSTARSSASLMREGAKSWIPVVPTPIAPRTPGKNPPAKAPASADPLPVVFSAALPQPGRPQFAQGPRTILTPATVLLPRIPNLLMTNKRQQQSSPNPIIAPAAAVTTPPVNNLQGTSDLPPLPPFAREIQIEIAPLPAPLAFDRAPYLQSEAAPDDVDPPAMAREGLPGHAVMK